jgi:membrane protease YdiL (CAAX protease family)
VSGASISPPGFARTVLLLLAAARKRAAGRQKRQQALLSQRRGRRAASFGGLYVLVFTIFMAGINMLAGVGVAAAVKAGEEIALEHQGRMVVDAPFMRRLAIVEARYPDRDLSRHDIDRAMQRAYRGEAARIALLSGAKAADVEAKLRHAVHERGSAGFAVSLSLRESLSALPASGALPALLGTLVLLSWSLMLVFQGEGLELDIQRRRHPIWEFLFSHPVPPGAVFMAEMLAPMAANPLYTTAALFPGVLYGLTYGVRYGVAAALLIGVPVTISASCLGKALEIAVMLRFPPRSRGAIIGLMGWLGYAAMMMFLLALVGAQKLFSALAAVLWPLTALPWPWPGLFLGQQGGGFSFVMGVFACDSLACAVIAAAVAFSVWGAQKGLVGSAGDAAPSRIKAARFGQNALLRKELLWFARDRSALVQAVLVPLTMAGFQLFNMRGLAAHAQDAWNGLCGAAILFGTYFLWVLGPKSLTSEGAALWIALTWPQGLEDLLRAKAWLWSMLSSVIVGLILCYAVFLFPESALPIALVGVGWFLFARSMADKAVTLATVTSSSGEAEKIPRGRRLAAQLGMLTFCTGVLTRRWDLAVTGIVYSMMTAAAMWQNFRARLPYLYDPWSERLPQPPTLMHAMIAISVLVELGATVTALVLAFADRNTAAIMQTIVYGTSAAAVSIGTAMFLRKRGVSAACVFVWPPVRLTWSRSLLIAVGLGLALGLAGRGYLALLRLIPAVAEQLHRSDMLMSSIPHLRLSIFVMAVCIAPFAEEYLFRGLLFRALDREWGGWRAVLGSAAFFASYHPALSWLPVAMLGSVNALLFRRTGRLLPSVATHMVYNAVVLWVRTASSG